jgi:hypothetical protein
VLKISMLYHARLNVEYTKINIIAFSEWRNSFGEFCDHRLDPM